jgi:hypothetical protein
VLPGRWLLPGRGVLRHRHDDGQEAVLLGRQNGEGVVLPGRCVLPRWPVLRGRRHENGSEDLLLP